MPDFSDPEDLSRAVIKALGVRSGSEATKAVAYWKPTKSFWAVKQNGSLTSEELGALQKSLSTKNVYDAWPFLETTCITKTGFHAEMVIVRAHLKWLGQNALPAVAMKTIEWDKLTVAANCDCCVHCQLAMEELQIKFNESDYGESNTAWWSPITDLQIAKDDPQFSKNISLLKAQKQSTY